MQMPPGTNATPRPCVHPRSSRRSATPLLACVVLACKADYTCRQVHPLGKSPVITNGGVTIAETGELQSMATAESCYHQHSMQL